jgi:hypothetical protein
MEKLSRRVALGFSASAPAALGIAKAAGPPQPPQTLKILGAEFERL